MQLQNFSRLQANYTLGLKKDGRNCVVVVAKGSWAIPLQADEQPALIENNPLPITEADEYLNSESPETSAVKFESDFSRFKARCDVLMHACAHILTGHLSPYIDVNLTIDGHIDKSIRVHGPRQWESNFGILSLTKSSYIERQLIHYGIAFGGVDATQADKGKTLTYLENPAGMGYLPKMPSQDIHGRAAPQLEMLNKPIKDPRGSYPAMSFGPIARGCAERFQYVGTYDDHWRENVRPLLPADFDERFYQCAPKDQQMPYLQGGETVRLKHVSPLKSQLQFQIPKQDVAITILRKNGEKEKLAVHADTLIIEPEENRFSIVWRAHTEIRNSLHEIESVVVIGG